MRYAIYSAAVLGLVAAAELRGWDAFSSVRRERVPPSVRSSPGGYRSYHFWHTGFQGGK